MRLPFVTSKRPQLRQQPRLPFLGPRQILVRIRIAGNDYEPASGTLTFAPGETTKTITIEVKGDNKKEANETFYLDLFGLSSNAQFTKNRGIGTILNDD